MSLLRKKCAVFTRGVLSLDTGKSKLPGFVRVVMADHDFTHFHLRANDEGVVLGYSDAAARFTPLALYEKKADAEAALGDIQKAMRPFTLWHGVRVFGIACLAVIFMMFFFNWVAGMRIAAYEAQQNAPAPAPAAAPPRPGTPVDADKLFNDNP